MIEYILGCMILAFHVGVGGLCFTLGFYAIVLIFMLIGWVINLFR